MGELSSRPLVIGLICGVLAPMLVAAKGSDQSAKAIRSASKERRAAFEQLDRLDVPDIRALPFVAFYDKDKPEEFYAFGFLLKETPDSYEILFPNFQRASYPRLTPAEPRDIEWTIEKRDPAPLLKRRARLYSDLFGDAGEYRVDQDLNVVEPIELFCAARLADHLGDDDSAAVLFDAAVEEAFDDQCERVPPAEMGKWATNYLGDHDLTQTLERLEDQAISRQKVVEELERFGSRFPGHRHTEWTIQTAEQLTSLKNDLNRASRAGLYGSDPKINSLIDQLVEQSISGWTDGCGESKVKVPAKQLADLGYAAVPALMAALDDERLTRSTNPYDEPPSIASVGDFAQEVLAYIACRDFLDDEMKRFSRHPDKEAIKTRIRNWYEEASKKGEREMLLDGLARADDRVDDYVKRLIERFPESSLGPISAILPHVNDYFKRVRILDQINVVPGDNAVEVLKKELKGRNRSKAAWLLSKRPEPQAIAAVVAEWDSAADLSGDRLEDRLDIGNCLAISGKIEAVKALSRGIRHVTPQERASILRWFDSTFNLELIGLVEQSDDLGSGEPSADAERTVADREREALKEAQIDLLVAMARDTEVIPEEIREKESVPFDAQIGDLAGRALSVIAPNRFSFDVNAPLPTRVERRLLLINRCRTEQGLGPINDFSEF